jgi:hypothetical protein
MNCLIKSFDLILLMFIFTINKYCKCLVRFVEAFTNLSYIINLSCLFFNVSN